MSDKRLRSQADARDDILAAADIPIDRNLATPGEQN